MRIVKVKAATYDPAKGEYVSEPVVLDINITPFQVTYYALSPTAAVEASVADPYPVENGKFVAQEDFGWFNAPSAFPNSGGFLGQPYTAIRLRSAVPGDELTVIQAGIK